MAVVRLAILVLFTTLSFAQAGSEPGNILHYSITGSAVSTSPAENATYAMRHWEVQRLLLDMAAKPRDRAYIEGALRGTGISLSAMISNGSIRLDNDVYVLNFALLTRADQEIIQRATDTYSQSLADAILARRPEIEALLSQYNLAGVSSKAVAFIVLGCFSLDWDGLALSSKKGYRAAPRKRPGGRFFVEAEEIGGMPLKGIYWGSHNFGQDRHQLVSFGDHFRPRQDWGEIAGILKRSGSAAWREVGGSLLAKVGALMFAFRGGPQGTADLARSAKLSPGTADELLSVLAELGCVRKEGELYRAVIPVFTRADRKMVAGLMRIGRQVMESWLAANYEPFRAAVSNTTPLKYGVPYPEAFNEFWHYLFGIANRKLAEEGLFADPYARDDRFQGFIPAVWEIGITKLD